MGSLIQVFVVMLCLTSTAAQQVFYVSSDSFTNTSCPFQPCATLSQYLLDNNGSLPVVSNVEYHFLPGEHHVPTNMTLQYLHNFTMTGNTSNKVVLLIDLLAYMKIGNSNNFTISRVGFETYDKQGEHRKYKFRKCNVIFSNCFSCKLLFVTFLDYGFCGIELGGKSYLSNLILDFTLHCYTGIHLFYDKDSQVDKSTIGLDGILMHGTSSYCDDAFSKSAIVIVLPSKTMNNMNFFISNSRF